MIRLLESAADHSPGNVAVVTSEGSTSYGELLGGAHRVASELRRRNIDRFAIVEPDAGLVIALLAGAALAGAEACQYQADTAPADFEEQSRTLGHSVVTSRRSDLGDVIAPIDLIDAHGDGPSRPSASQPLMIRTTGTTGLPKAARHDWELLARTADRVTPRPDQRWLLAYGPHQFAGIQVMQHVVASRATLIAPFPRLPRDGLAAMLSHSVTCVSATPTYWRFLLAEARSAEAQLPPLEQVTLGGEASAGGLLDELRAAFPDARISHVYASTEFGSVASVRDGLPGFPFAALFSESNPSSNLRVIDGELWVRSKAGMLGYAGNGSQPADADEWRATGDLVEIADGRVLFRGRSTEIINVGGVKVPPLPIEDKISRLDRVALARVFGRPNPLTGAIVAAEIVPASGVADAEHEEIRQEIRTAVADLPRAWHPRSINFVDAIETRGDKTVRGVAR